MVTFTLLALATIAASMFTLWLAYNLILFLTSMVNELLNAMFSLACIMFVIGFVLGAILL